MKHLEWKKKSRLFNHADEGKPGQFTWKSSIGQHNVDLGDGTFAPYVWDGANRVLKFGLCEIRLTASGLEFWHEDRRLNAMSVHPEVLSNVWERKTPTVSGLTVQEIDDGRAKVRLNISYQIVTGDMESTVSIHAGGNQKVHFAISNRVFKTGTQRINVQFAEKCDPVQRRDPFTDEELPPIKYTFGDSWYGWKENEVEIHAVDQKVDHSEFHLDQRLHRKNEVSVISPDTWGTDVGISAGGNDGHGKGDSGYSLYADDSTTLKFGNEGSLDYHWDVNFRWLDLDTIPQGSTIDTAALDVYCSEYYAGGHGTVYAWDVDEAPVNSAAAGNYIWDTPKTTENAAFDVGGTGWRTLNSADFVSVVQEIFTSYATDTINLQCVGATGTDFYAIIEAYENAGTNEAELTITYTAADGGVSMLLVANGMGGNTLGGNCNLMG